MGRTPFSEAFAEVVLGLFRVYLLEISRRVAASLVEGGAKRLFRTKEDEKENMSAIINREDISKSLAGIGQNSRMAALKVRHAFRSAVKDIQKSAGEHSHELSTATKGSLKGVERYVRKNPFQSLLISLGVGLCVGVFVRR
jgi:ElaB/YqjD/DUF883 family membrane-anchored ribosome-binding protein